MRFNPNSKSRWKWPLVISVPIAAFLIAGKTMNTSPPTNSAQTTPDETPELRTRTYSQSVDEVFQAAQTAASEQKTWFKSWRIVPKTEVWAGPPHHEISVEVPVLFFTDDLTIDIDLAKGGTAVNVESHSRVGKGDFGENRRHIAQFLRALDQAIGNSGTLNP